MKINWKVRVNNKVFWITMIPAILLFIQAVASVFGLNLDLGELGGKLLNVVETAFVILTILGVVTDHTTKGVGDSENALTYEKPKE